MAATICRICGTSYNLMHVLQGGQELLEKLRVCANIQIDFERNLPQHICLKCEQGLNFSYQLRKQGEATEQKLRRQLQQGKHISEDLFNDVDDVEEELQKFSVQNANKTDDSLNEDDNYNHHRNGITKIENKDDEVVIVKPELLKFTENAAQSKITGNHEVSLSTTTTTNHVDTKDIIEVFTPLSMSSISSQQPLVVAATGTFSDEKETENIVDNDVEIIGECENEINDKSDWVAPVDLEDDDVQIIEEFQPSAENYEDGLATLASFTMELTEADDVIHLDEMEYMGPAEIIPNTNPDQYNHNFYGTSDFADCHLEGKNTSDIHDYSTNVMQSDAAIITQDIFDGGIIQEEYNLGLLNNVNNGMQMIDNRMELKYETIEKPSIDLIEKIEVGSDDGSLGFNDNEGDAEEEEEGEPGATNEVLPDGMQSTLLSLQNRGSLKISVIYKCETCSQSFLTQSEYRQHIKEHGRERFGCSHCTKWFPSRYRLQQHERTHSDDSDFYICSICAKHYRHPQNLKRHMRSVHNTECRNPYQCGLCKEVFHRPDILKNHMTKHSVDRNFNCELCPKSFKSMFYLMAHKRSHLPKTANASKRPSNSTNCTPTYTSTSTDSSSSPYPSDVANQRTYYCAYCGKVSKHSFAHKNHLRTHTNERPFPCDFCVKKFRTLAAKIIHERIHNDVRPYQCSRCLLSFRQSSHLKEHVRIHDGIMPYSCSVCNIAFAKKSNLKVHMRIHTGETPYKCADSECGEQFAKLSQLKRHAAQAHARDVEVREGEDDDEEEFEEGAEEENGLADEEISEEDGVEDELSLRQCNITNVHMIDNDDDDGFLDVGVGAEETAMEMMIGSTDPHYNSLYIMDEINSS